MEAARQPEPAPTGGLRSALSPRSRNVLVSRLLAERSSRGCEPATAPACAPKSFNLSPSGTTRPSASERLRTPDLLRLLRHDIGKSHIELSPAPASVSVQEELWTRASPSPPQESLASSPSASAQQLAAASALAIGGSSKRAKPAVVSAPSQPARRPSIGGARTVADGASRLEQLSHDRAQKWAALAARRAAEEEKRLASECTFKPIIHGPPPRVKHDEADASEDDGKADDDGTAPASWENSLARRLLRGSSAPAVGTSASAATREWAKYIEEELGAGGPAPVSAPAAGAAAPSAGMPPASSQPASSHIPIGERLFAEADRRALTRARVRAETERQKYAECTFKPAVSGLSSSASASARALGSCGASPGGAGAGASAQAGAVAAGGSIADAYLAPPAPRAGSVPANSASALAPVPPVEPAHKPLHERAADILAAREAHLAELRARAAAGEAHVTFQPRVSAASQRLAAERLRECGMPGAPSQDASGSPASGSGSGSGHVAASAAAVTARLTAEAELARARRAARAESAAAAEAARCTFAPRLDSSATAAAARARAGGGGSGRRSFIERQEMAAAAAAARAAEAAAAVRAAEGCTFAPDTGNAAEVLALCRPARIRETSAERMHRLSSQEAQARTDAAAAAAEAHYARFTFAPKIDANSRARGRAHSAAELAADVEGRRARARAAALAEADFRRTHTFAPALLATADGGSDGAVASRLATASDPAGIVARIAAAANSREERLEAARRRSEYAEMKECTFAPTTSTDAAGSGGGGSSSVAGASTAEGPVVVRGLGRFLELKELSRRKAEEQREREATAFEVRGLPEAPVTGPRPLTVPQPFSLSERPPRASLPGANETAASVPPPPTRRASAPAVPFRPAGGTTPPAPPLPPAPVAASVTAATGSGAQRRPSRREMLSELFNAY